MKIRLASSTIAILILSLFGATATARQQPRPPFVEIPGKQMFSGRMIVRPLQPAEWMKRGLSAADASARRETARRAIAQHLVKQVVVTDEYIVTVPPKSDESVFAAQLMATGLYEYAEPDWICSPIATPNDPLFSSQWHHTNLQSVLAWDQQLGSADVIVAICDTGVSPSHPDLTLVPGRNIVSGNSDTADINGHGTFCAGMAAAKGNNGLGVVGAGWNLRVMPVRVSNLLNGDAFLSDLTGGATWAAENGAWVINVSYSGVTSSSVQTAGAYCRQLNRLLFWAAGNDGLFITGGDHPDVVIVGASTSSDARAGFSNYGALIDVVAPGASVVSTGWSPSSGDGYFQGGGTSFSSPLAAGVAAMIWSENPSLTSLDVENILKASANDLGPLGEDEEFGEGRVNTRAALIATPPLISITSQPVSITSIRLQSAQFDVSATGANNTYAWEKNGTPVAEGSTGTGSVIAFGNGGRTLLLSTLGLSDEGAYRCLVSNSGNSTYSSAAALDVEEPGCHWRDMVAHWSFDGDTLDRSGFANHGTIEGNPTFVTGIRGQGLMLDGIDDSVMVPDAPCLNPSAAVTITAWYKAVAFAGTGNDTIVDKGIGFHQNPYYQYHLGIGGTLFPRGNALMSVGAGGNWTYVESAPNSVPAGQWRHIAGVYDGSFVRIYVDGQLTSTLASGSATGLLGTYGQPLRMGRFNDEPVNGYHLPGVIDEVRIFRQALSQSDINFLRTNPCFWQPAIATIERFQNGGTPPSTSATFYVNRGSCSQPGISYQWRRNGAPVVDDPGHVSGAMTATMTIDPLGTTDAGSYDCVLTSTCNGTLTSNTVNSAEATYDLVRDWSDAANPNGTWTYRHGTAALPSVAAWQPGDFTDQTAWAPGSNVAPFIPAWFKSNGSEAFEHDWLVGDVVVHTDDSSGGGNNQVANVIWTSPFDGLVRVSGGVWLGRDIGRSANWSLSANNYSSFPVSAGVLTTGDTFSRANPAMFIDHGSQQVLSNLRVIEGGRIELRMVTTSTYGDFVGADMKVDLVARFTEPLGNKKAICRLAPSTIQVGVAGSGPWQCYWYVRGQEAITTAPSLTITPVSNEPNLYQLGEDPGMVFYLSPGGETDISLYVYADNGAIEWYGTLAVGTAPLFEYDPAPVYIRTGSTAAFNTQVTQSHDLPLQVQWHRNGVPLSDGPTANGSVVSTTLSPTGLATLTITNASPLDSGLITCTATNCSGSSTSAAAILSVCYGNCDQSNLPPVLNANDFLCFLNAFAAAQPYANCDGSTVPPIHNANDFSCFLNSFAAGCP